MAQLSLNTSDYKRKRFVLPAGSYTLAATSAETKEKDGGKTMLIVTYTVMEGNYEGKNFRQFYNIVHPNERAQTIALEDVAAVTRAVGKDSITDTDEILNVPFVGSVKIDPDAPGGPANRLGSCKKL